jgi:hypothetical protein
VDVPEQTSSAFGSEVIATRRKQLAARATAAREAIRAGDIDAHRWESLYRTESMPFDTPSICTIAVKVINDYGDEVMKVFGI